MIYLDTSALAKWYLNEPGSEDFAVWVVNQRRLHISSLTVTEFRCLLARRRRAGDFSIAIERRIHAAFLGDLRLQRLRRHRLADDDAILADRLIEELADTPLRTLDALHLAIASRIGAKAIATADRVMAKAAESPGFQLIRFG